MPKLPRWTSIEAEARLRSAGFELIRTKGSHRIFKKDERRVVVPFHAGRTLHPKIIREVLEAIQEAE